MIGNQIQYFGYTMDIPQAKGVVQLKHEDKKGMIHVATTTIGKWGNSMGIRIPQELLETAQLGLGAKVEMELIPDQGILLRPATTKKAKTNRELRKLFLSLRGKNTPDQAHEEMFVEPMGDEII
ncbi:AbrB/MazE/SpoVT family DNA-binding domain-containing protein [Paenibacillus jiagnxiensis]|uniref:AbrB/MazE/SpoVT family DNA-binding domain-containing protein n=1 Tax=Paenibacillus jiagnxiensis TaxID=3228926 RepID=UPI0038D45BD5